MSSNFIYSEKHVPYTYSIQWSTTGMKYYGVRFAKNCHPKDFWVSYFTSSKYVATYVEQFGPPDIRIIRKTFTCSDAVQRALLHEKTVLRRIRAAERTDFLNKYDGGNFKAFNGWNKGLTKETSQSIARASKRISKTLTGRTSANDVGRKNATDKLRGRTKETHEYISEQSKRLAGRTKENDESKRQASIKISLSTTGRTKRTHAYLAARSEQYAYVYEITFPDGSVHNIKHIKQWASDNNLNINNVYSASRTGSPHRGFKFKKIEKL